MYTISRPTYPLGPYVPCTAGDHDFAAFRSTTSRFQNTRLSKIGQNRNAPNDLKITMAT